VACPEEKREESYEFYGLDDHDMACEAFQPEDRKPAGPLSAAAQEALRLTAMANAWY